MDKELILKFKDISLECVGYEMGDVLNLVSMLTGNTEVKTIQPKEHKPFVRKTDTEIVDLREIGKTIKMPKLTSSYRCPNCGQGIIMKYISGENSIYLVRNIYSEKQSIHEVNLIELPDMLTEDGSMDKDKVISVYKDLLLLLGESKMIIETDHDMGECPICKHEDTVANWIEAGEDTLKHFDALHVCEICGEEGNIIMSEDGDRVLCDYECTKKVQA